MQQLKCKCFHFINVIKLLGFFLCFFLFLFLFAHASLLLVVVFYFFIFLFFFL